MKFWRKCAHCGKDIGFVNYDNHLLKYCSNKCKQAAYRKRKKQK